MLSAGTDRRPSTVAANRKTRTELGATIRTSPPYRSHTLGKLNYIYIVHICIVIILSFCRVAASNFGRSLKEFSSAQSSRSNSPMLLVSVNTAPTTLFQHCSIYSWAIKPINQPAGFICLPYLVAVFSPLRLSPCRLSFLPCFAYCSIYLCLFLCLSLCNLSSCKQNAHPFCVRGVCACCIFCRLVNFLQISPSTVVQKTRSSKVTANLLAKQVTCKTLALARVATKSKVVH